MKDYTKDKKRKKITLWFVLKKIIYFGVFIPLIIITTNIGYQLLVYPDEIPNIFGYKFFMIMNEQKDGCTEYGDLIFTKIIDIDEYKIGDIMAFRNNMNTITVHRIAEINTSIADNTKVFTMQTIENETDDTKYVRAMHVEGKMVHRISNLGIVVMVAQDPLSLLLMIIIVLIIGVIAYYIAQQLDERDRRIESEEMQKNEQKN
ncbi:MAG: hypothetical protein IKF17_02365 [Clostridia bacterium]|nr:hypothetical protein [Clostridia bacterium]